MRRISVAAVVFLALSCSSGPSDLSAEAKRQLALGAEALKAEKADDAITAFTAVIQLAPAHPKGYTGRARAYRLRARNKPYSKTVVSSGNKTIEELQRDQLANLKNLELSKEALEDDRLAIIDLSKAIELDPKDAKNFLERGDAYRSSSKEDWDRAIADYTSAIDLKPDNHLLAWAHSERGQLYCAKGNKTLGLADIREAVRLDPDSPMLKVVLENHK